MPEIYKATKRGDEVSEVGPGQYKNVGIVTRNYNIK